MNKILFRFLYFSLLCIARSHIWCQLSLLYVEGSTVFCQESAPDFVSSSCIFADKKTLLQILEEPGSRSIMGRGGRRRNLFKQEADLVPRVLRGHWDVKLGRGWQESALWEGEESFFIAYSFYYTLMYMYIWFIISA